MVDSLSLLFEEEEAVFTDVEGVDVVESFRVWRVIPSVEAVLPKLNSTDRLKLCGVFMHLDMFLIKAVVLIVLKEVFALLFLVF